MGAHVSVPMYRRALPQRLCLEGRQCENCGYIHFPPAAVCPRCRAAALVPYVCQGRGTVHSVTAITAAGAPPEFADLARAAGSFYVAIVELAEGPKITAQLVGFSAPPEIGRPVQATIRQLYTQEGVIRYGFKFEPAEEDSQ